MSVGQAKLTGLWQKALRDNEVFAGVISDLIVPSLRNKEEPALREQGLICLALCCMIEVVSYTSPMQVPM